MVNNSYFLPLLHSKLLSKSRLLKESTTTVCIPITSKKKKNLKPRALIWSPKRKRLRTLVCVDYLNTAIELLLPRGLLFLPEL